MPFVNSFSFMALLFGPAIIASNNSKAIELAALAFVGNRFGRLIGATFAGQSKKFQSIQYSASAFCIISALLMLSYSTAFKLQAGFLVGAFLSGIAIAFSNVFLRVLISSNTDQLNPAKMTAISSSAWSVGAVASPFYFMSSFLPMLTGVTVAVIGFFLWWLRSSSIQIGNQIHVSAKSVPLAEHRKSAIISSFMLIASISATTVNSHIVTFGTETVGLSKMQLSLLSLPMALGSLTLLLPSIHKSVQNLNPLLLLIVSRIVYFSFLFVMFFTRIQMPFFFLAIFIIGLSTSIETVALLQTISSKLKKSHHLATHSYSEIFSVIGGLIVYTTVKFGFEIKVQMGISFCLFILWLPLFLKHFLHQPDAPNHHSGVRL